MSTDFKDDLANLLRKAGDEVKRTRRERDEWAVLYRLRKQQRKLLETAEVELEALAKPNYE